ncbi:MAG: LemA family protein [Desulfovibrio sp.]|nr:LemA family protein [Desulfovibrio sp.]
MSSAALVLCVLLGIVILILMWGAVMYNGLVRLRNLKEEGWSGIDVQLKRRHDLVDNLVSTVKGYMTHESSVLEEVARCRASAGGAGNVAEAAKAETGLTMALGRLFAVMENYPELRATENVMQLQTTLAELEDNLQMARRYYNGTVRELNTKIEMFPSNIVANMFHFTKADFFELDNAEEAAVPRVQF